MFIKLVKKCPTFIQLESSFLCLYMTQLILLPIIQWPILSGVLKQECFKE